MIITCDENENGYYLSLMSQYIRKGDVHDGEKEILNRYINT